MASIGSGGPSTVSSTISQLASQMLAKDRQPIQALQAQRQALASRSSVLGALKTKLTALKGDLDTLKQIGTLSPLAVNTVDSSNSTGLTASATATAAPATLSVTVSQLARRSTHVSDRFTDVGTAISGARAGTFAFSVTIAGTEYKTSVTINSGDTDKTVLDSIATAITAATDGKASAVRIQTETGYSRLSISSIDTGTANRLAFTDTDGLLAQVGVAHGTPTVATDTSGGYIYEDLGGHELDAKLVVDGLTYYRGTNTVGDLVSGVTLNLKATSTSPVTVKIQRDADQAVATLQRFIGKYNDALDYLAQQTFIDPKAGTRGLLALDPIYGTLASQLRRLTGARVSSQASGTVDTLSALGLTIAADGKLSIGSEATLRAAFGKNPAAVTTLFSATDGIATTLAAFVGTYVRTDGQLALAQTQIGLRMSGLDDRISTKNAALAKRQTQLEQQLAKQQALVQQLAQQSAQINSILGVVSGAGS
jgi:flagellar hook-associated protein 2